MKVNEIIKETLNIIRSHLGNKAKVYLFGSWAKGSARENSDIDLAVEVKNNKSTAKQFTLIKNEVEAIKTLRKIDVIDLSLASEKFKNHIFKYAIKLML